MKKFNYSNRKNILSWITLIFFSVLLIFITFIILDMKTRSTELNWTIFFIPVLLLLFLIILINKMFLAKIYITPDYIEYKSPFENVKIKKERIKGIDLLKKRRRFPPRYLSLNEAPEINFGNYFIIVRKTKFKPDSPYFLLFKPVDQSYITLQYRQSFMEALKEYGYI